VVRCILAAAAAAAFVLKNCASGGFSAKRLIAEKARVRRAACRDSQRIASWTSRMQRGLAVRAADASSGECPLGHFPHPCVVPAAAGGGGASGRETAGKNSQIAADSTEVLGVCAVLGGQQALPHSSGQPGPMWMYKSVAVSTGVVTFVLQAAPDRQRARTDQANEALRSVGCRAARSSLVSEPGVNLDGSFGERSAGLAGSAR
jgi:hypothetical protein